MLMLIYQTTLHHIQ